jgi:hypothetical protein
MARSCSPIRTTATPTTSTRAFAVWKRCDGRATTLEIADALTAEYDVDFDTALDDVEQLVAFFAQNRLAGIPTSHDCSTD